MIVCGSTVFVRLTEKTLIRRHINTVGSVFNGQSMSSLCWQNRPSPHNWISFRLTVCDSKVFLRLTAKTLIRPRIHTVSSVVYGWHVKTKSSSGWQRRLIRLRIHTSGPVFDGWSVTAKSSSVIRRRIRSWVSLRWTVCDSKVFLRLTAKTLIRLRTRKVGSVFIGRVVTAKYI